MLIGPRELRSHLDLSVLVDKHVFGLDVSKLLGAASDVVLGGGERVEDVPKFAFLEEPAVGLALFDEF